MNTLIKKNIKAIRDDLEKTVKNFIPRHEEELECLLKKLQHEKSGFDLNDISDIYDIDSAIDALHFYNYALKELIKNAMSMQEELNERENVLKIKIKLIESLFINNNCD